MPECFDSFETIMLKKIVLFTGFCVVYAHAATAQEESVPYWKDVRTVSVNKESPRTTFIPFHHKDSALTGKAQSSTYYQSLNGKWKFKQVSAASADRAFVRPDYDVSGWSEISVPGNWQTNGYGHPVFADSAYEFNPVDPRKASLPDNTPVGIYRTTFKVPYLWSDRQTFLHIGAVKSGCYVWVNGQKVGYTEDSKNPAEFDITPYVKEGMNTLAIEVYAWSTGSYLESQDTWRLTGIDRDVYLVSQPRVRIRDYVAAAWLDPSYQNGNLDLAVIIKSHFLNNKEVTIFYDIFDPDGKRVSYEWKNSRHRMRNEDTVYFHTMIPDVKKWTAETPNLYTVLVRLQREKRYAEHIVFNVGFRNVEMKEGRLTVNGTPIRVKGVNYHEHHPVTGHAVDEATLEKDLEWMKKYHVNAIRTGQHPQSEAFYRLCDKYGFYVFDEANIDSKAMGYEQKRSGSPANDPQWLNAHLERVSNMYERNKNHPCVVAWSLGNDAGNGYNFYKAYESVKAKEKNRPVLYNMAGYEWNTDIIFPQYPALSQLNGYGASNDGRPFIIAKMLPSFSRDASGMKPLWEQIGTHPNVQGGFIANWNDQGLMIDGRLSFGADYAVNHDGKGVVSSDRIPHPEADLLKEAYADIIITPANLSAGEFTVRNAFDFIDLSGYELAYKIHRDGKDAKSGRLPLSAKPGTEETVIIPLSELKSLGSSSSVSLEIFPKQSTPAFGKEYPVVSAEFPVVR